MSGRSLPNVGARPNRKVHDFEVSSPAAPAANTSSLVSVTRTRFRGGFGASAGEGDGTETAIAGVRKGDGMGVVATFGVASRGRRITGAGVGAGGDMAVGIDEGTANRGAGVGSETDTWAVRSILTVVLRTRTPPPIIEATLRVKSATE